jgi:DNA repair exonuclease SbcCD nuclease subunit
LRLLHTADWQLGLRLNFVGGDAAVRLRAARFDTVRRIGALARARSVNAVLVAGDVFDDNGVGADTVQQARDALAAFGDIPLVLLPGNHEPATADSALRRPAPVPGNVRIAVERAPIALDGARGEAPALEIYPCPLLTRHHYDDPGAWLPARGASRAIRIALAHGGALAFGEPTETPNHIDVAAILDRGFDYVALGDWHGVYRVSPRAWYPGAPEATRYKEKRPGYVLIVDIDGPGREPRVEQVPIARSHWLSETVELTDDGALDGLAGRLEALDEKSWTLLELDLTGQLSLAGRARLDDLIAEYSDRLAHLRIDTSGVTTAPTQADLTTLHGEGFLGRAIDRLRAGDDPADADALRLLYRLMQETG